MMFEERSTESTEGSVIENEVLSTISNVLSARKSASIDTVSAISSISMDNQSGLVQDFKNNLSPHDAILNVGGVPLYINKEILFAASDHFADLFGSKKVESSPVPTIEMKDVKLDEFMEFMNQIHNVDHDVTKDNLLIALKMSQKYRADGLLKKCEQFLSYAPNMKQLQQRTFAILQFVFEHDLENIENKLRYLFRSHHMIMPDLPNFEAFILPNDHICMNFKNELMKLEPEIISFILTALMESARENPQHSTATSSLSEISSNSESTTSDGEGDSGNGMNKIATENQSKLGKRTHHPEFDGVQKRKQREMVRMSKIMNNDSDLSFIEESSHPGKVADCADGSVADKLGKAISFSESEENLSVCHEKDDDDSVHKCCAHYGCRPSALNDCPILIDFKTIYVNAKIVSGAASYFNGRLKNGTVLELGSEVSFEVFLKFLEFIYPAGCFERGEVVALLKATHLFGATQHYKKLLRFQKDPKQLKTEFSCTDATDILDLLEYAVKNDVKSLKKFVYLGGFKAFSSINCPKNCNHEEEDVKTHQLEADGVYHLSSCFVFQMDMDDLYEMTNEAKKFILACLIKDKNNIL